MNEPARPLPAFAEFAVPASWRCIDFLSDLHLGEDTPRTFEALATHLRCTQADAVFMLGDLFEVWVGDDARHEGFEAQCAAMLAEASSHRFLGFMAGNRDFLVGHELLSHCGVMHLADPTVLAGFGSRLLISHGDALCLADSAYQQFRAEVRGEPWQRQFLSQPLSRRREIARGLRAQSEERKRMQRREEWVDLDRDETVRWMQAAGAQDFVHGHTHLPASHDMGHGLTRLVLSDWDLDDAKAPRADVLRWSADGLARIAPATAL
ncbi:UDP-2,3-diacylglucosamine diphosphatase [Piscinibacter terrae]|uniref:UDP-2,3-diacylglucosamine hydrolase n=1 Tax=Piscinibacter terrae TaxID=2496871 RepID=A0A3N7HJC0_9BURK|nr:UDP-2,3-diacylglucosamine diphosphatase [Albitalea terrae]RQP22148.1 UDP-2,3-diacylglucosamine diphosphatase [Albitalea terrae]